MHAPIEASWAHVAIWPLIRNWGSAVSSQIGAAGGGGGAGGIGTCGASHAYTHHGGNG